MPALVARARAARPRRRPGSTARSSCWTTHGLPTSTRCRTRSTAARAARRSSTSSSTCPTSTATTCARSPLRARRQLLKALLDEQGTEHVRFSADFEADPASDPESACRMNLEGVIAKRADAPYVSRRTETWLKLKCQQRQEFVVCGYTDRSDGAAAGRQPAARRASPNGELVSAGSVGTGWDADEAARSCKRKLSKLEIAKPPFAAGAAKPGRWSKRAAGSERWVEPRAGRRGGVRRVDARRPDPPRVFVALRADKPAQRDRARDGQADRRAAPVQAPPARPPSGGIKVSNPERVIDPSTGLTKLDLVRYYESVADWILPHLKGRPVLAGARPDGHRPASCSSRSTTRRSASPASRSSTRRCGRAMPRCSRSATAQALVERGADERDRVPHLELDREEHRQARPHDLRPRPRRGHDAGSTCRRRRCWCARCCPSSACEAWLKTSGGKGLHVVVPLAPRSTTTPSRASRRRSCSTWRGRSRRASSPRAAPSNRVGRIFVDYLRNGHGATTAAAFSARARPGLGVSMPVAWDELAKLKSGAQWTIATAREYLSASSRRTRGRTTGRRSRRWPRP